MSSRVPKTRDFAGLDQEEIDALIAAATWYAKRHDAIIAELADDSSAMAVSARRRHDALHDALAKLGVRLRRPAPRAA